MVIYKLEIEGNFQIIDNIILNGRMLKNFLLILKTVYYPLLTQQFTENPAITIRKKCQYLRRIYTCLTTFLDSMTDYIENWKNWQITRISKWVQQGCWQQIDIPTFNWFSIATK